jgi:hypothetical protein
MGMLVRTTDRTTAARGARARLGLAALAASLLLTVVPRALADLDASRFVPVDELRPGDRCVGRTVFSGNTVEEFDVEILGIVRGTAPESDLIIARASGGPLGMTGIMEGMSGSPVYLNGRLVGAISSTWAFTKEPIAGVTPIAEMLPALDLFDDRTRSGGGTGGSFGALAVPEAERPASRAAWLLGVSGQSGQPPGSLGGRPAARTFGGRDMVEISLPLVVSGGGDGFLRGVSGVLAGSGFTPVRGSSGNSAGAGGADPVPGSAVGVQLVRGDANWTAIGTLTHREGDRVVAFGHPLFQGGDIELPMVGAYVHALMPLQSVSFKYASGSNLIGTVFQDRRHMVAGRLGAPPAMIGLSVAVGIGAAEPRVFDLEVVRARPYASLFAGLATAGAVDEVARAVAPSGVEIRIELSTDAGLLKYADVLHTDDPAFRIGGELTALMDVVLSNSFAPRDVSRVSVDVRLVEEERWAEIERVDADRAVYRPGEDVLATVTLSPWQGRRVTERMTLHLPSSTPDGPLVLRVAGAAAFRESERERLGAGLRPRNYDQLVSLIERSRPGNAVVGQVLSDVPGISLSGEEMRAVPGRAALAMTQSATGGVVDRAGLTCVSEAEILLDRETRGAQEVVITVRRDP